MPYQKFTAVTRRKILNLVEEGNYAEVAANACGVSRRTLQRWIQIGKDDLKKDVDSDYAEFVQDLEAALAKGEISLVDAIRSAGSSKTLLELLSRRHSSRWASTTRIELAIATEIQKILEYLEGVLEEDVYNKVLEALSEYQSVD